MRSKPSVTMANGFSNGSGKRRYTSYDAADWTSGIKNDNKNGTASSFAVRASDSNPNVDKHMSTSNRYTATGAKSVLGKTNRFTSKRKRASGSTDDATRNRHRINDAVFPKKLPNTSVKRSPR